MLMIWMLTESYRNPLKQRIISYSRRNSGTGNLTFQSIIYRVNCKMSNFLQNLGTNVSNFRVSQDLVPNNIKIQERNILPLLNLNVPGPIVGGMRAGLAYDINSNVPIFSNGNGWQELRPSSIESITWVPYGQTTSSSGTTWKEVYDIVSSSKSTNKVIVVDPSAWIKAGSPLPNPFVIPPGIYDIASSSMIHSMLKWVFISGGVVGITITVQDGVKLNGLREINGPIDIEYQGNLTGIVPPVFRQTGACVDIDISFSTAFEGSTFILNNGATIKCTGTAPFIQFTNTQQTPGLIGEMVVLTGGTLKNGTSPCVSNLDSPSGTGAFVIIPCVTAFSNLATNTLSTVGVLGTSSVTTGGFLVVVSDVANVGGLPFVLNTYFPNVATNAFSVIRITSSVQKANNQSVPPGVINDNTQLFQNGDMWIDSALPGVYVCVQNTTGAALWTGPI